MAQKLTDKIIKTLPLPATGERITYDAQVKGFGVRVTAKGARSFLLNYRTKLGRERRYTIGAFGDWQTGPARTEAIALRKQIDQGGDPLGEIHAGRMSPTVRDLCERFIADHLPRLKETTRTSYKCLINAEIIPALGSLKVAEVTFADVDRLHQKITKRGRPYHANRAIATLSKMLTLAVRWQMRPDNPCESVERNTELKRKRYLSPEELGRLTAALTRHEDQQAADIVRMLLLTGARRGEVLAAKWQDIDLAAGDWRKPASTTKTKIEHQVPLSEAALALLTDLQSRAAAEAVWLFPARTGNGHRKDIRDAWARINRAAGISDARAHDLRHTYASVLASAGQSLPIIGGLLGHATPVTTARYAHLFSNPLRAATDQAGRILSGQPSADVVPLLDRRRD